MKNYFLSPGDVGRMEKCMRWLSRNKILEEFDGVDYTLYDIAEEVDAEIREGVGWKKETKNWKAVDRSYSDAVLFEATMRLIENAMAIGFEKE